VEKAREACLMHSRLLFYSFLDSVDFLSETGDVNFRASEFAYNPDDREYGGEVEETQ